MRFKSIGIGVALMLCCASAVFAQGTSWFGYGGGVNIPQGDFKDLAKNGWHFDGSYTYMVTPFLGLGADVNYHAWGAVEDLNAEAVYYYGAGSSITFNDLQFTAHVLTQTPGEGRVHPFARVGAGEYKYHAKLSTDYGYGDYARTHLGFYVGGGVNARVNETMFIGIGGAYHQYEQDPSPAHFVTADLHMMWRIPKFGEVR